MDVLLDLWVNTVYNDEQVQSSEVCPVVYMRNGSGNPLISYASLSQRWHMSKATVGRYLKKLNDLEYIFLHSFSGTHGTIIYLKNYLSTMFQISDVILDKEEIAMALNIKVNLCDSVSNEKSGVSKSDAKTLVKKIREILTRQGFPCFKCSKFKYKLLPLSDCQRTVLSSDISIYKATMRYLLMLICKGNTEIAKFEINLHPSTERRQ